MLPRAKNGSLEELVFFAEGIHECSEFVIPEVFEAFLEHLHASKVPPIETLPMSFEMRRGTIGGFKNPKVERAFHGIHGLVKAVVFSDLIQSKTAIGDLLVARWPDVMAWLWYFYVACFERNLGDKAFKILMAKCLNMTFAVVCHRDKCTFAIAEIPGTMRLATLLCMLSTKHSYLSGDDASLGTFTLFYFVMVLDTRLLDEVLETLGGNAKLFADTIVARLEDALNAPKMADKTVTMHVTFFVMLYRFPEHPLWLALRAKHPIVILTNVLRRLSDSLCSADRERLDLDSVLNIRHTTATLLVHISVVLLEDPARTKMALQTLQAGILGVLIDCAPLAFDFETHDRDGITKTLQQLTWLTTHLPIARQASAELERLESTISVQGRFNASLLDVRQAWVTFYDAVLARRTILSQMQALNSTPMACDNVSCNVADACKALKLAQCFRFDERANFKKCAGCGMAHYCSKDCQSRAWKGKGHRAECKSMQGKPGETSQSFQ